MELAHFDWGTLQAQNRENPRKLRTHFHGPYCASTFTLMRRKSIEYSNALSLLLALVVHGDLCFAGSLSLGLALGDLGHLLLLLLNDLHLASLDLSHSGIVLLVTLGARFVLHALDIGDVHADDRLLDTNGLTGALLGVLVGTALLVELPPCGGPGELDSTDFLVVHLAGLVGHEEVEAAISGDETTANTGVDFVFGV